MLYSIADICSVVEASVAFHSAFPAGLTQNLKAIAETIRNINNYLESVGEDPARIWQ